MFRLHQVWKRLDEKTAVIYYCFEDMEQGGFYVQNAEFVRLPIKERQAEAERQAMELFIEACPSERGAKGESLALAIALHDASFAD